jgi:hypothetical protein
MLETSRPLLAVANPVPEVCSKAILNVFSIRDLNPLERLPKIPLGRRDLLGCAHESLLSGVSVDNCRR